MEEEKRKEEASDNSTSKADHRKAAECLFTQAPTYKLDMLAYNPFELAEKFEPHSENHWYFTWPMDKNYLRGPGESEPTRKAKDGYWKATGPETKVTTKRTEASKTERVTIETIEYEKEFVYYFGNPPEEIETAWMMTELRKKETSDNQPDDKDTAMEVNINFQSQHPQYGHAIYKLSKRIQIPDTKSSEVVKNNERGYEHRPPLQEPTDPSELPGFSGRDLDADSQGNSPTVFRARRQPRRRNRF